MEKPFWVVPMGAQKAADVASSLSKRGSTNLSQGTATSIPDAPASETATSGSSDVQNLFISPNMSTGGIVPASYGMNVPQRSMGSGIQQTSVPALIGGGVQLGRGLIGAFMGGAAAGMLAPTIIDPATGQERKLRVTRRLRSQVKQAVQMFGVEQVADQMGVGVEVIFYILTKKMRNDGSYVTRSPVRRTASKTTLIKN